MARDWRRWRRAPAGRIERRRRAASRPPGLIAVPLLVLVMLVSNDRAAMGERTNGRLLNVVGWVTTIIMGVAAIGLIVTTILG